MAETKQAYLSVNELAMQMGVKKNYIYQLIFKKKLPIYKPLNGRVFFKADEIDSFMSKYRQPAESEVKT